MNGHRTVRLACVGLLLVAGALVTGGTSALAIGDVTITVNQVGSPIASAAAARSFWAMRHMSIVLSARRV